MPIVFNNTTSPALPIEFLRFVAYAGDRRPMNSGFLEPQAMARRESDREDLMAEATALRRRVELDRGDAAEPIVVGFRDGGRWSVYFGGSPVYHFDERDRLRRVFADGYLYRTQGTTLARLSRVRTPSSTTLSRHDLAPAELAGFLQTIQARFEDFRDALAAGRWKVLRQVPERDESLTADVRYRVSALLGQPIGLAPRLPGRR